MTQPREVVHASKLFQDMLAALKERAMLVTHNQAQAQFRGVLVALRRHMTTDQLLNFADALAPLPRGIMLEGWRPRAPAPLASPADLYNEIVVDLSAHHVPPPTIVEDVFAVLAAAAEPHDAETMRRQLPDVLKPLWPAGRGA